MSEQLARQFHEIYERLAPYFGYETRTETRRFDPTTPNGRLMIAVTDEIENVLSQRITDLEACIIPDEELEMAIYCTAYALLRVPKIDAQAFKNTLFVLRKARSK